MDIEERNNSILKYRKLAYGIAYTYLQSTNSRIDDDDLTSVAILGLISAIETANRQGYTEAQCMQYLKIRINGTILDYLRDNRTVIRISRYRQIEIKNTIAAGGKDILADAYYDNYTELDSEIVSEDGHFTSFQIPINCNYLKNAEANLFSEKLYEILKQDFTDKHFDIFTLYHGLFGKQSCTAKEVGKKYNISKQAIWFKIKQLNHRCKELCQLHQLYYFLD